MDTDRITDLQIHRREPSYNSHPADAAANRQNRRCGLPADADAPRDPFWEQAEFSARVQKDVRGVRSGWPDEADWNERPKAFSTVAGKGLGRTGP
jgi:hypothetical protein